MKNVVRMFTTLARSQGAENPFFVRQSTFSDNVVVSAGPAPESVVTLFLTLAMTQLVCARMGFLLRGSISIGNILHDEFVVLGPALVKVYDLERLRADKPKIILDPDCLSEFGPIEKLDTMLAMEDGVYFLNPWTLNFARAFWHLRPPELGNAIPPKDFLATVLGHVLTELKDPPNDDTRRRLIWLRDRIRPELLKDQGACWRAPS